jgi:hypothetical protein
LRDIAEAQGRIEVCFLRELDARDSKTDNKTIALHLAKQVMHMVLQYPITKKEYRRIYRELLWRDGKILPPSKIKR